MGQAANQTSESGNVSVPGITSKATTRKKRFGGSSLATWLTMALLLIFAGIFFLYLLVPLAALLHNYREGSNNGLQLHELWR